MNRAWPLLLAPLAAFAQGPAASVQVLAPGVRAIAGETVRLEAVVRDANGMERSGDSIQWTVDTPAIATIQNGMLSARSLGFVRVTAAVGQIRNTLVFQVVPKRLMVSPAQADLTVGDTRQFEATALDVNDQPIPNLRYRWVTWSGTGGQTNIATVNASGMVRTSAVGTIQVRAFFDYTANGAVPGFERQAQAAAVIRVRPPQTYKLTRLLSTGDPAGPFELRARIVPLLGNERGQIVFNAALGGLSNGPLLIDGANRRLLASGGLPGPLPQTVITDFNEYSLNNRGEVLTRVSVAFSNNVLYKLSENGADPVFIDNTPLPGTEFLTGHFINRNSLNDEGGYLMRANYRVANAGPTITALFRVPVRGFPDEVISNAAPLDGIPAGFSIDNDFGIAGSGLTYFTVTSQGRRHLYVRAFDAPRKLLSVGDPLLNSTVRAFAGNGFIMNNAGDLAVAVTLANNEIHLLRYSGTNLSAAPRSARLRSFSNVYAISPAAGMLFLGDAGRAYGVHLWKDGDPELVFQQNSGNSPLRGKPVQQIDYAAVSGSGEVSMLVRTADHEMELVSVRKGEEAVSFLKAGDSLDMRAPVSFSGLLQGDRTGPAHIFLGGFGSSIWEVSPSGRKPVLLIGERISGISLFTGANTANARKAPNGDIYLTQTSGQGLMRIRGGERDFALRPPMTLSEGITAGAPFNVTVNGRGDLLWQATTNRGDQRLVLTRNGQHTSLLSNAASNQPPTIVDGERVASWAGQLLDGQGRVMATLRFPDNSSGLYIWQDGTWRMMAAAGATEHRGRPIVGFGNMRAAEDGFYVVLNLSGLGNTLARWRQNGWETVIATDDAIVTGHLANSVGTFEVNRSGDVFAQCNTNSQVLVVKRGDRTHYIHALNDLTPDGDLIVRTTEYDLRDDGTVYFFGLTAADEYVLYMARPM